MEEKKRRPRVTKADSDNPLQERGDTNDQQDSNSNHDDFNRSPGGYERPSFQDRPQDNSLDGGQERRPYQDRSQDGGGGYERRPYQDRSQGGGGTSGGGGYERRPYQDRSQGGGGTSGGGGYERRPYQDRSQGGGGTSGGGGYERRPYQDRSQGGGGTSGGGGYERRPYQDRSQGGGGTSGGGGYERRPYQDRSQGGGGTSGGGGYERRPYQDRSQEGGGQGGGGYERRPYQDRSQGGGGTSGGGGYERRPYQDRSQEGGGQGGGGYERRPYQDRSQDRSQGGGGYERRPYQDRSQGGGGTTGGGGYERRPYQDRSQEGGGQGGGGYERRPYQDRSQGGGGTSGGGGYERRPYQDRSQGGGGGYGRPPQRGGFNSRPQRPKKNKPEFYVEKRPKPELPTGEAMPLNKFLAHCGISSRRKAVEFIEAGNVTVNGLVVTEPYYRYQLGDMVTCEGNPVTIQERMIYVLLNKPKGVITTTEDERGRTTIMDIVDPHFPERIYPVGRLDRDTTGLILLTNDGDLAQKLTHPSHHVQKQYRIGLDQGLTREDYEKIVAGVELEDGPVNVNWVRFAEDHPMQDVVELEITMGRNRIVRRLFETLGYQVKRLDRFYFAGLTKKDLARGAFRELSQREVIMLKHFTGQPIPPKPAFDNGDETAGDDFEEDDFTPDDI